MEIMQRPFEDIVRDHGVTVLRVCRAVVGPDDADDAWSETFLAAMPAFWRLPDDANVEAWLVTIAHRKAIDILRRRARHAVPVEELPECGTQDRHTDFELWAAVRELPAKQRMAIAYHYVAGLPFPEVAEILGGTPAAARRAAADGMKKLREHYGQANR